MAVIGIIFASLAFLCMPLSLLVYFIPLPQSPQGGGNPLDGIKNDSMLFGWIIMSSLVGWLLSIFQLAGSIGALGLRQWSRQLLVGWSIISLLTSIISLVGNAIYVQPRMAEILRSSGNPASSIGEIIGLVIGIFLGIGVPAATLIVMTRPSVKDAFARGLRPVI